MKNLMGLFAALLLLSCQQQKIGYVDNVKLMDGYQKKQDVEAEYQRKSEIFSRKRDSISQVFQLEAQELQNRSKAMSEQKAQEAFGLFQQKGQMVGQQLQQEEQQMQRMGQMKMDSVVQQVRKAVKEYGKANGFTFILTGGEGGSVLYGDEKQDITEEILKVLNEADPK